MRLLIRQEVCACARFTFPNDDTWAWLHLKSSYSQIQDNKTQPRLLQYKTAPSKWPTTTTTTPKKGLCR